MFLKALLAGIFSAFTIGVLTVLTYKSALGLFLAGSFDHQWFCCLVFLKVLLLNQEMFFGHLVTAMVGVIFVN